jgi:malate dehydrogenase (oxaloacetate-decarboxylating)(NADP+)
VVEVPSAVARAAMESGVATRPKADLEAYRQELSGRVFRTGFVMKSVFSAAKSEPRRVVYAEGEEWRVLQAVQIARDEGFVEPVVIGRRAVVGQRIERLGLRIRPDKDFELVDPQDDPRYREYWEAYHAIMERKGVSPARARTVARTENTVIAALGVRLGAADAMIAGPVGRYQDHLRHVLDVIGLGEGVRSASALQMLVLNEGIYFVADTNVRDEPDANEIAETTILSARQVRRFGMEPKVALLSHSNFGSSHAPSARKMRAALEIIRATEPELEVEGEMQADVALSAAVRDEIFPSSRLTGSANLLIMPSLDAGHIAFNLLKHLAQGISVGPMLVGMARPAHVLNSTVTVRGIVNMSALAVVEAQMEAEPSQRADFALAGDG